MSQRGETWHKAKEDSSLGLLRVRYLFEYMLKIVRVRSLARCYYTLAILICQFLY